MVWKSRVIATTTRAAAPSIDAVQEFKVVTSANAPEFGRAAGGTFYPECAGSNAMHGSLSGVDRPAATAERDYFATADSGPEATHLRCNARGAGAPESDVLFARTKVCGTRTSSRFWTPCHPATSCECCRMAMSFVASRRSCTRAGHSPSSIRIIAANQYPQQFAGNVIPAGRVSRAGLARSAAALSRPEPARHAVRATAGDNFSVNQAFTQHVDSADGRVDHAVRDADCLSVIYHLSTSTSTTGDRFAGAIPVGMGAGMAMPGDRLDSASHSCR